MFEVLPVDPARVVGFGGVFRVPQSVSGAGGAGDADECRREVVERGVFTPPTPGVEAFVLPADVEVLVTVDGEDAAD